MYSNAGKGDKQIPAVVSNETVTLNWSNVFGKSKLQQRLEAERLAEQELADAVQLGLAKLAE
jgi:hypothetical protein